MIADLDAVRHRAREFVEFETAHSEPALYWPSGPINADTVRHLSDAAAELVRQCDAGECVRRDDGCILLRCFGEQGHGENCADLAGVFVQEKYARLLRLGRVLDTPAIDCEGTDFAL